MPDSFGDVAIPDYNISIRIGKAAKEILLPFGNLPLPATFVKR